MSVHDKGAQPPRPTAADPAAVEPAAAGARAGEHGILAPAARLDPWLLLVLLVLLATSAVRYLDRHGMDLAGVGVLAAAVTLALVYATRTVVRARTWWPTVWVCSMVALWAGLTVVAPSFAWSAVPVAFAVLQVLPFGWAVGVVVAMTLLLTAAWQRISTSLDLVQVAGPIGIALLTVLAYRALDLETRARQRVLDELVEAQTKLAQQQHRTGALAERTRLSREIHDSVGQGLSSINLLLQAAEQSWTTQPDSARDHVATAAATAREGLDEVRRVVRDLAPAELTDDQSGTALVEALQRAGAASGLDVAVRIHGEVSPVPAEIASALVRTARGALANVREHAHATRVALTLTHHLDEVVLDIRDDGRGFTVSSIRPSRTRGRGLAGIRERAATLGGHAEVESAPGEGTTISVSFPLNHRDREHR